VPVKLYGQELTGSTYAINYRANGLTSQNSGSSTPPNQPDGTFGRNHTTQAYTVTYDRLGATPNGVFGVNLTPAGQGVPWDGDSNQATGTLPAWSLSSPSS
jgi:hypothetical protein